MDFFEFFFPQQAQAAHLRQMARSQRRAQRRARSQQRQEPAVDPERIEQLEDDLGTLTMVLGGLMRLLDERGVVTRDDMRAAVRAIDGADGEEDGKLNLDVLRGMIQ